MPVYETVRNIYHARETRLQETLYVLQNPLLMQQIKAAEETYF